MPPPNVNKYFIALLPPPPLKDEIHALKLHFQQRYNSKAALNSPPHLTLHMPFEWKANKEERLIAALKRFAENRKPFSIQLKNFSSFPPRVIYIDVVSNTELDNLQRDLQRYCKMELQLFNARYRDLPFHPHITLAFRDLKKNDYEQAWQEFKDRSFAALFEVKSLVLLKHDGKVWQPCVDCCF